MFFSSYWSHKYPLIMLGESNTCYLVKAFSLNGKKRFKITHTGHHVHYGFCFRAEAQFPSHSFVLLDNCPNILDAIWHLKGN